MRAFSRWRKQGGAEDLSQSARLQGSRRAPAPLARPRLEGLEDRRLLTGGVLDPTFGTGGSVISPINTLPAAVTTYPQAGTANDGKIVVVGHEISSTGRDYFAVARYNLDGSLDTTFGTTGEVYGPAGWATAGAVQPDGKILAAGTSGSAFAVVRFNADGSLDKTFGNRGEATTTITAKGSDEIWAIGLQADGKIVVAGATEAANSTARQLVVARYNANGSLDTTFGRGGLALSHLATSPADSGSNEGMGLAIDPGTGQVVVEMASPESTPYPAMLVRYTSAGVLDTSFAGTGYETLDGTAGLPSLSSNGTVAIQPSDHRILLVAGGLSQSLVRLNADGTLDGSAPFTVAYRSPVFAVKVQSDGRILVGANTVPRSIVVTRYNTDLTLDTSFGAAGVATYATSDSDSFEGMALEPDGRIVVAGRYLGRTTMGVAVARFLATGPEIGTLTAAQQSPGAFVTLTAGNIVDENPNCAITQVEFYYFDSNGTKVTVGTSYGQGGWTVTCLLPAGTYRLYGQAEDSYGVFGDPTALDLQVL